MFAQYLSMLRCFIPYDNKYPEDSEENKIFLICDAYGGHHSKVVYSKAERLHIEIIPIPKGCTDKCQPMDVRIFGCLKQQAKGYYSDENAKIISNSFDTNTTPVMLHPKKKDSIQLLLELWDKLSSSIIEEAWDVAIHGLEDHIHNTVIAPPLQFFPC